MLFCWHGHLVICISKQFWQPFALGLNLQGSNTNLPKLVKANISGGEVTILGRRLPLPFKGIGFFSIMYVDDSIRVFSDRDKGTVSLQVQADRLQQLLS